MGKGNEGIENEHYFIRRPGGACQAVNAWSAERVPFQPRGWQRSLREDLKAAIKAIAPGKGGLYAAYVSEDTRACDAENILFYNIGTSVFRQLSHGGLRFERGFGPVKAAAQGALRAKHYYHYSITEDFCLWSEGEVLSSWRDVPLPAPGGAKAHAVWHAMKKSHIAADKGAKTPERFGLSVQLSAPKQARYNLAALAKPLLDGIVCAFHRQSAPADASVLQRLSKLTGEEPLELQRMLQEPRNAVLGPRPVVFAYRSGIKWNPADDGCVACQIAVDSAAGCEGWKMSGRLFSVAARNEGFLGEGASS